MRLSLRFLFASAALFLSPSLCTVAVSAETVTSTHVSSVEWKDSEIENHYRAWGGVPPAGAGAADIITEVKMFWYKGTNAKNLGYKDEDAPEMSIKMSSANRMSAVGANVEFYVKLHLDDAMSKIVAGSLQVKEGGNFRRICWISNKGETATYPKATLMMGAGRAFASAGTVSPGGAPAIGALTVARLKQGEVTYTNGGAGVTAAMMATIAAAVTKCNAQTTLMELSAHTFTQRRSTRTRTNRKRSTQQHMTQLQAQQQSE